LQKRKYLRKLAQFYDGMNTANSTTQLNDIVETYLAQPTSKQEIKESLVYASRIQKILMPTIFSLENYYPKSFTIFKPKDILSGDFFWWTTKGDKIIVAAVDCTGHGVPGALLSFLGISTLNQIVSEVTDIHPDIILNLFHFRMTCILQPNDAEFKLYDGMEVALLIFDKSNYTMEFSGANLPVFCIKNNEINICKGDPHPIAGQQLPHEEDIMYRCFTRHSSKVNPGDRFFIASDGLKDLYCSSNQFTTPKRLGLKGVQSILSEGMNKPMRWIEQKFNETIQAPGSEALDDILLVGFELA